MASAGELDTATITVAHTADLPRAILDEARAVLDLAFDGDFDDDDWDHGLGGLHAVATADGAVVGHASLVQRNMVLDGTGVRVGYVEGVGVHPDRQRLGIGGRLMEPLERAIRSAYDLGALGASDEGLGLYRAHGWVPWEGPLGALTPEGPIDTPEERGAVLVLPGRLQPDVAGRLVCDHREGDLW